MISLEQIKIASPCPASWAEMTGTEQVRFCQGCRKNVYNLSAMSQDEAQALVTRTEGHLCVRFYRRADGTMLTRDCPVGQRAVRFQLAKKRSYAAALLLACTASLLPGAANAAAAHHAQTLRARVKLRPSSRSLHQSRKNKKYLPMYVTAGEPMPPPYVPPPLPPVAAKPIQAPMPPPPPPVHPPAPPPALVNQPVMGGITPDMAAKLTPAPTDPASLGKLEKAHR